MDTRDTMDTDQAAALIHQRLREDAAALLPSIEMASEQTGPSDCDPLLPVHRGGLGRMTIRLTHLAPGAPAREWPERVGAAWAAQGWPVDWSRLEEDPPNVQAHIDGFRYGATAYPASGIRTLFGQTPCLQVPDPSTRRLAAETARAAALHTRMTEILGGDGARETVNELLTTLLDHPPGDQSEAVAVLSGRLPEATPEQIAELATAFLAYHRGD